MTPQHKARRLALQGLCCLDVQGEQAMPLVSDFIHESQEPQDVVSMAGELLRGTFEDKAACDDLLTRHAKHWDLSRLAMVDRNILRLAAYELRHASAPMKVVIVEALNMAKEFSSAESSRFINGVLDAIAKELSRDSGDIGDIGDNNEKG